jgi:hypothetical protein
VIRPVVIFLKNSSAKSKGNAPSSTSTFSASNFVSTFFASWSAASNAEASRMQSLQEQFGFEYEIFELPDSIPADFSENGDEGNQKIKFPLGWTLSKQTQRKMDILIENQREKITARADLFAR